MCCIWCKFSVLISELGSQNSMTSGVGHWHHFCDKWLECWYHAKVISLVIFSSFCFCIPSSALQRSLQIFCTWVFLIWMLHIYVELAGSVLHQNSISFACWHCLDTTDQRVIFFVCLINFSHLWIHACIHLSSFLHIFPFITRTLYSGLFHLCWNNILQSMMDVTSELSASFIYKDLN